MRAIERMTIKKAIGCNCPDGVFPFFISMALVCVKVVVFFGFLKKCHGAIAASELQTNQPYGYVW